MVSNLNSLEPIGLSNPHQIRVHKPIGVFTSASFCKMPSIEIMTAEIMEAMQKGVDKWTLIEDMLGEESVHKSAQ